MPAHMSTRLFWRQMVPAAQREPQGAQTVWDVALLRRIKARIEGYGLTVEGIGLSPSGRILMGRPGRDEDLALYRQQICIAASLGIKVITYNFTALRASEGYGLRAGRGKGALALCGTMTRRASKDCLHSQQ